MSKKSKRKHGHGHQPHQSAAPVRDDEKLARERDEGNAHDREVVGKMRDKLKGKKHGGEKKPFFLVSMLPMPALGAIIIVPIVLIWLAIPRDLWMLVFGVWLTWVTNKVKSGQEWRGGWTWFAIVVMGVLSLFLFTLLGIIATVLCAIKARKPEEDDEEDDEEDTDE